MPDRMTSSHPTSLSI